MASRIPIMLDARRVARQRRRPMTTQHMQHIPRRPNGALFWDQPKNKRAGKRRAKTAALHKRSNNAKINGGLEDNGGSSIGNILEEEKKKRVSETRSRPATSSFIPCHDRPHTSIELNEAVTSALLSKISYSLVEPQSRARNNEEIGLQEWKKNYLSQQQNAPAVGINAQRSPGRGVTFRSNVMQSFARLVEVLQITSCTEYEPSELRTAVSIEAISNMVKLQGESRPILAQAMKEIIKGMYHLGEVDSKDLDLLGCELKSNMAYFSMYQRCKQANEELLRRNAELCCQIGATANASATRSGSVEAIVHRWRQKVQFFVFSRWVYITQVTAAKRDSLAQQYIKMTMYKKYKATFYAWKHSIMERKAAKFTELKKFLDEADETNDRLSDKVLEMEKEISRLQLIVKKFDEERDRKIEGEVHTTIDNMVAILILDAEATPPTKRTSFLASC